MLIRATDDKMLMVWDLDPAVDNVLRALKHVPDAHGAPPVAV